jgi:multicomponent Na+:H+ antiporter subunit B
VSRRLRICLLVPALGGFAALFGWGVAGLPAFGDYRGPYGMVLDRVVVPARHISNIVAATTFDVRGVDTMGEELILYAAVLGVVLLLRGEREQRPPSGRGAVGSDALRLLSVAMVGGGVLVGLWLVAFGYVTPGGGFQGGVVIAASVLLVYLAGGRRGFSRFRDERFLDPVESVGAAGYVVIGLAALASGLAFLTNVLGPGTTGTLVSGGSVPFLNWAVAIEVAAANLVLIAEFLEAHIAPLGSGRGR